MNEIIYNKYYMDIGLNMLRKIETQMNLSDKLKDILSNNRLLMMIIVGNIVVYILFSILTTFFKIPIVLFLGTVLGVWVYMKVNKKKD